LHRSDALVKADMDTPGIRLSRISKLFLDRDETTVEHALERRRQNTLTLICGPDVEQSYTLQLAVLTAANIANRCFPRAVRIVLENRLAEAPLLVWPSLKRRFGQALAGMLGTGALNDVHGHEQEGQSLIFGSAAPRKRALRVTFDGWIAMVGPAGMLERLPEREYCALSGVLAGSMAISEMFLSFAKISIEASRRIVALSLWRPDLDVCDPSALGIQVQFLPRELWVLGLGHLGNAYLWSLATLPYANPAGVEIFLNDFDKVEPENTETGLIFDARNAREFKTRVCAAWLEERGFHTRIVERRFDSGFRCRRDEPGLALCGFDANPARRDLATAEFRRVIESGLGGTADNFDTISVHTLPNPRTHAELWPDLSEEEEARQVEHLNRMARENAAYARLDRDECGRYQLAGQSVAVPFVGSAASCLVLAEALRLLHGGPAYTDAKLGLATLSGRAANRKPDYGAQAVAGIEFCSSKYREHCG
jgi:hypothetical protein